MIDYKDALAVGWIIIPLHRMTMTATGVKCLCERPDCEAAGKHPKASNWQAAQPFSEQQLAYLEDEDGIFGGNQLLDSHGVVLKQSGLLVVDVDGRNGGFESAKALAHIREQAGYIVETGSGSGEHWYFKAADADLRTKLDGYPGIDFKSSGFVVGCGSLHKSGHRYEAAKGSPADVTEAPAELLALLARPPAPDIRVEGASVTMTELTEMMRYVRHDAAQSYDRWLAVGMALHHATSGSAEGAALWESWTQAQGRDDTEAVSQKWHSFGKSSRPVTQGTLMQWAREGGYTPSVTFVDDTEWEALPVATVAAPTLPQNSLVRACFEYIDGNCMFPRQAIALAASIQAVGNAAGLRYRVGRHETTLNLMSFAIADSGTGKEAIYQSILELMRAAGLSRATHGGIKSEQEIIRNLIRNQSSLYVIDEYGTELAKIASAKKSGSAQYLMSVPERIMSIYSKAAGFYPVSGDMAEEQRERLEKLYSAKMKQQDEGRDVSKEVESLKRQIKAVDVGIEEPFLSFFGITEPFSFDAAINNNHMLLINGFMSRALIFREDNGAPKYRKDFTGKKPVPFLLGARLFNLYAQGNSVEQGEEVRRQGEVEDIQFTPEAERELDIVSAYWEAENERLSEEGQGLQSISNRAREMVIKLAAIVAIPADESPAIVEVEHIRYAQAMVSKLVAFKLAHVKMILATGTTSLDREERGDALLENITRLLADHKQGLGLGVIRNRLRLFSRENIEAALAHLKGKGIVSDQEYKDSRNRTQRRLVLIK